MNTRTHAALIALATLAAPALAGDLYSNGSANPALPALHPVSTTTSGVAAPSGFQWSECQAAGGFANAIAGFSAHAAGPEGHYRFADDFTVPPGGWTLSGVTLYAYSPGAAGPNSPFAGLTLRIWLGRPGDEGSFIIWGDAVTNRLASSTSTGIYRVFNSATLPLPPAPDTSRLVWASRASIPNLYLAGGTFWLDWQYTTVSPDAGAFSPPVTTPASRGSGNALQYHAAYGSLPAGWRPALDTGKPAQAPDLAQDLPFILDGSIGALCDPDVNCDFALDGFDVEVQERAVGGDTADYCQPDPDFNRDFALDGFDVEALELAVGGGPCP